MDENMEAFESSVIPSGSSVDLASGLSLRLSVV